VARARPMPLAAPVTTASVMSASVMSILVPSALGAQEKRIIYPMPAATAVDVHAHYFGTDVPHFPDRDPAAPRLVVDRPDVGRILCGDETFRVVTPVLWDVAERLRDMDRAGLSHQVISPVPVAMEHAWCPDAATGYASRMNDSIAAACAGSGGRLLGLGCLPFADIDSAVVELTRCMQLGLHGVEVGTRIGALDLDAPQLDPFWAACDSAGTAVFVHPILGGRGVVRRAGQPYDLGLGMLADTAIAASALVFGGVLARYPRLRIALAHGCGAFPWAYPRLKVAAGLGGRSDPPSPTRGGPAPCRPPSTTTCSPATPWTSSVWRPRPDVLQGTATGGDRGSGVRVFPGVTRGLARCRGTGLRRIVWA